MVNTRGVITQVMRYVQTKVQFVGGSATQKAVTHRQGLNGNLTRVVRNENEPILLVDSLTDDIVEHTAVLEVTDFSLGIKAQDGLERRNRAAFDLENYSEQIEVG